MCKICSEWELGRLTTREALRNLGELVDVSKSYEDLEHYSEVAEKVMKERDESSES